MTISTRRFCSRPVEVELDTSGRELPKPRTVERPAGNPCPSSIWRTLSARFPACDSVVALSESVPIQHLAHALRPLPGLRFGGGAVRVSLYYNAQFGIL